VHAHPAIFHIERPTRTAAVDPQRFCVAAAQPAEIGRKRNVFLRAGWHGTGHCLSAGVYLLSTLSRHCT
jgi:hypothetical protein